MENLLKPDIGLMFWTVVTFLVMIFILKKAAWGPILNAIDEREKKIKSDLDSAQKMREELEKLKSDYQKQLDQIQERTRALLADAELEGLKSKNSILAEAELEAKKLVEKTRQQLEVEKDRLVLELRHEVGEISLLATEKLLGQSVDKKVQEKFIQDFIKDIEISGKKKG